MILHRIAFAVETIDAADQWAVEQGAGVVAWTEDSVLHARQYIFTGGGRLEFVCPMPLAGQTSPIRRFLDRNEPRIHHLTIQVDDFDIAVRRLRREGFPVGRIQSRGPHWREGYLAPADTGNILVQIGWHGGTDESWAREVGHVPEQPADDGTRIAGAKLRHVDLDRAQRVWRVLGGEITRQDWGALSVDWPGSPLNLVIERGDNGPAALLVRRGSDPGASVDPHWLGVVEGLREPSGSEGADV